MPRGFEEILELAQPPGAQLGRFPDRREAIASHLGAVGRERPEGAEHQGDRIGDLHVGEDVRVWRALSILRRAARRSRSDLRERRIESAAFSGSGWLSHVAAMP